MFDYIEAEKMRASYARALVRMGKTTNSAKTILAYECARRGYTVEDMRGPRRTRDIAHARQEVMDVLRNRTNLSLPQIGRMMNRDHTTVLHALRAVAKRRAQT